jgi:pSer/pThr/pTyr-binding forkhead associated (FHA) protein
MLTARLDAMAKQASTLDTPTDPKIKEATERFDRNRAMAVAPGEPGRYLQVQGPDQALLIPLSEDVLHVGRGLAADLRLDHSSVSRRHAIIASHGSGTRILDDRSLNGTLVNGRRIERADLHAGDAITIGRFELRYVVVAGRE